MLDSMEKDMTKGKTEQDMMPLLELSISNIINQIIFGYRFTGVSTRRDEKHEKYALVHYGNYSSFCLPIAISKARLAMGIGHVFSPLA